jgi:hypothetical protein
VGGERTIRSLLRRYGDCELWRGLTCILGDEARREGGNARPRRLKSRRRRNELFSKVKRYAEQPPIHRTTRSESETPVSPHPGGNKRLKSLFASSSLRSGATDPRPEVPKINRIAQFWPRWREAIIVLCVLMGGTLLALLALLAQTGHFVYPFDAAYVHLALASQIATGHYGINPGEAAAPSSTIIYPYLVAFVSALGVGQLAPLTINVAAPSVLIRFLERSTCFAPNAPTG